MGVSPKLVVGAWVGGEYRSIHFRTGALGQGSRTALPICGYFLDSVLKDPAFKQYHAKFGKPKDDAITRSMYTCDSYYPAARRDTTANDSIGQGAEEIILDENGNPIAKPTEENNTGKDADKNKTGDQKQRRKSTEEEINLDNL